ncbi:MAG: cytochrome c oxidase subunit 3 family protein [Deltaproteobacteria bacterium]|nr:cytochrome c oxidase subunit 3 family protein [Deltaproteobacteria bacterium]
MSEQVLKGGHVVPHHFESAEQAFESSKTGIWLFLATEVLMFGGLFVAYIIFRALYPVAFHEASLHLNRVMGAINTVVLISSSFTMAMAIQKVQENKKNAAVGLLVFTLLCAATFMVIKYFEYSHKIHEGLLPAGLFTFEGIKENHAKLFFSLYFMMTGLHGIHVLVGIGIITWITIRTAKGNFSNEYYTPVELTGLYWHLVDLIWIFLFPLLYLVG